MAEELILEEQKTFRAVPMENNPECCFEGDTFKSENGLAMATYTPFTIRTSKPASSDKNAKCYIKSANGGWSGAVTGNPTDSCNVLANCVGYAQGRFCEIINEITGSTGNKYPYLNCDASGFIDRAKKTYPGLVIGTQPKPGGIMVWGKGWENCGHVAIVERLNPDGTVFTSESAWGGPAFRNNTRSNNDGRWGTGSNYVYLGCIYNPAIKEFIITPTVDEDIYRDQVICHEGYLRVRTEPNLNGNILGFAEKDGRYNYFDKVDADGYTWYRITDKEDQWFADGGWLEVKPRTWPARAVKVSNTDKVKIETSLSEAKFGDEVQINVIPSKGYIFKMAYANNEPIKDNKFIMPDEDVTITAEVELTTFYIKVEVEGYGDVKVSKTEAVMGDKITLTVTPGENYLLETIGSVQCTIKNNEFVMPAKNVVIKAIFVPVVRPKFSVGDKVLIHKVGNTRADGNGSTVFHVGEHQTITNVLWAGEMKLEPFCYELSAWNGTRIGFYKEEDLTIYHEEPTESDLKVGDTVKIKFRGNSKPDGTGYTTYGLSWKREIMGVVKGALYPYKVGKNGVVQGYYNATGLTKIK